MTGTKRPPLLPDDLLSLKAKALARVLCERHPEEMGVTEVAIETGLMEARAVYEKMITEGKLKVA